MSSSPYFQFGAQRRYPFAWHGGPGGVPQSRVAAESRELSGGSVYESGADRHSRPFPGFRRTRLHAVGDWPSVWPNGLEPTGSIERRALTSELAGMIDGVSNRTLGVVAAAALGFLLWKKMGKAGKRGSRRLSRATRRYVRSP